VRSRLVFAVVASLAGACLFPSLSDLTGDAGNEGPDVQPQQDAGKDVATDAAPFSCKTADATFCEDFDDTSQQAFPKWNYTTVDDGGQFLRVDAGLSLPNAGEVIIAAAASGQPIQALLAYQSKTAASRLHVAWDCIIDQADIAGPALMLNEVETSGAELGVRLVLKNGGASLGAAIYPPDGGSDFPALSSPVTFEPGVWHHVEWTIDLTATPATLVSFSIDGAVQASDAGIPGATFGPSLINAYAGAYYATVPTAGWRLRIDDVVVSF
jgi:hypothetical protein